MQERFEGPTVFLVEDDAAVRDSLVMLFEDASMHVESYASGREFLQSYEPGRRGCLVLDVHMPGMSGMEVHEQLAESATYYLPTIFLTGHAAPEVSDDARRCGVIAVFEKPCRPTVLLDAIEAVFRASAVESA